MKLFIYSHYFAPSIGGVETIVISLARGLAELRAADGSREFELTVVTQTPRENFDDSRLPFRVVRQPGFWKLMDLVRGADVVHVAGPALAPMSLGLLSRKPVVIEHHGFQVICPTGQMFIESSGEPCPGHFMASRHAECWRCDPAMGWLGSRKLWLLTFVRRFLSKHIAANIMPTNWLGEQLKLPHSSTIHHGLVQIQPPRKSERQDLHAPVIAFQGRLVTTKGARVLLEAARILCEQKQDFRLVIIGDGPEKANLEALTKQPPLLGCVRFTGRLAPLELETELAQACTVVVPSLGGEVFGLVAAESMQRGLPVIASDLGSLAEVLGDAGVTFRTGDPNDLAKKLSSLLVAASEAMRLSRESLDRAEKYFRISKMVHDHASLYSRIANPHK